MAALARNMSDQKSQHSVLLNSTHHFVRFPTTSGCFSPQSTAVDRKWSSGLTEPSTSAVSLPSQELAAKSISQSISRLMNQATLSATTMRRRAPLPPPWPPRPPRLCPRSPRDCAPGPRLPAATRRRRRRATRHRRQRRKGQSKSLRNRKVNRGWVGWSLSAQIEEIQM